ncbi:MAG TPA: type IV toxin-antitoxin system AbiEi family antitoxin [Phycisphaerae bacterium]|nr:type IV toxin-antitoxin system AbiEi family antitoxin [Phycisphaerae bacterium]HRY71487.1 type IV toxin-antitoxin system AbiEi family antitoxin [Phycisphaerae bacterium]HSA29932.1 type IV toxin-antitoxin system AbiEi family antitoxin [Phycisphaerae bacterium]
MTKADANSSGDAGVWDALVEVSWAQKRYRFGLAYKQRSTPKVFDELLAGLRSRSRATAAYPMLMVPYLSPQQLAVLEENGISGIDLCGNGVVMVPGQVCVFRTGQPNRYRQSDPIKNIYRGTSSIVPRVFLSRPRFSALREIEEEIRTRNGRVVLSTISKVVSTLDQDLLVRKKEGEIRLLQPEALLERLAANYRPPRVERQIVGECDLDVAAILAWLSERKRDTRFRVVASGLNSLSRYAIMAREAKSQIYCSNLKMALDLLGARFRETPRFANLELVETNEDFVYFDARVEDGVPWAAPAQVFLELMSGDKRDRETADQVRDRILQELRSSKEAQA